MSRFPPPPNSPTQNLPAFDEKDPHLSEVVKQAIAPVIGSFTTIGALYQFVKLWRDDRATIAGLSAGLGYIVLWVILLYVGFSTRKSLVSPYRKVPRYAPYHAFARGGIIGLCVASVLLCAAGTYLQTQYLKTHREGAKAAAVLASGSNPVQPLENLPSQTKIATLALAGAGQNLTSTARLENTSALSQLPKQATATWTASHTRVPATTTPTSLPPTSPATQPPVPATLPPSTTALKVTKEWNPGIGWNCWGIPASEGKKPKPYGLSLHARVGGPLAFLFDLSQAAANQGRVAYLAQGKDCPALNLAPQAALQAEFRMLPAGQGGACEPAKDITLIKNSPTLLVQAFLIRENVEYLSQPQASLAGPDLFNLKPQAWLAGQSLKPVPLPAGVFNTLGLMFGPDNSHKPPEGAVCVEINRVWVSQP